MNASVQLGEVRLHYRFDGHAQAPVLLLINSLGTEYAMWDAQVPALARDFRVLRYDARGQGASDAPAGDYGIGQLGADALGLLDALGIGQAHVCGLSMGGMVGMWLALQAPARVGRLVLANTAARIGAAADWDARIARVRAEGMGAVADMVVARWFSEDFRRRQPQAAAAVRSMLLRAPVDGYAGACAAIRDMDQRQAVRAIGQPTLVLAGRHDTVTPPQAGHALVAAIDGARYLELEAAHLSNIEAPEAFTAAVLDFLCQGA